MSAKVDSADLDGGPSGLSERAGSTLSFREIFDANAPYIWRTLRRLGVREADANDMCQEVFVVVHRRLGEFDGTSSIRTWIYGITTRVASQYRRRAERHPEELSDAVPEAAVAPGQESRADERMLLERLELALERLDEHKRAVFVLYELEELTMSEVAQALGCPLQTAYSRLHAARESIQRAFRVVSKERAR